MVYLASIFSPRKSNPNIIILPQLDFEKELATLALYLLAPLLKIRRGTLQNYFKRIAI
jgi:hypothetical protein